MEKHFDKSKKMVGVTIWMGGEPNNYVKDCVLNNIKYFEEFYLITDLEEGYFWTEKLAGLKVLKITQKQLIRLSGVVLSPKTDLSNLALYGDILCHLPKKILWELSIDCDIAVYLDANFYVYSSFIVNSFRNLEVGSIYYKRAINFYSYFKWKEYLSSDFSVDLKSSAQDESLINLLNQISSSRYTAFGPSLMNKSIFLDEASVEVLDIIPDELDPTELRGQEISYPHKKGALGFSFGETLVNSAGYQIDEVNFLKGQIDISYEEFK